MVNCLAEYTNDYISTDRQTGTYSTATNMYEKMLDEGHDARLLRFSPSADGTIKGGHTDPKNFNYWQIGCLGITPSCSQVLILRNISFSKFPELLFKFYLRNYYK